MALIEYDPRWPALFEAEAERISEALTGTVDFTLDHFGSTAIPGLAAKPIIDIMVTVDDLSAWPGLIEPIKGLGYVFWPDNPRRDRLFFVKGMPPFGTGRTHHVHVRTPADAHASILFRDYLRRHPEDAVRYASLKRELADRYSTDREGYTDGKARFVEDVLLKAAALPSTARWSAPSIAPTTPAEPASERG